MAFTARYSGPCAYGDRIEPGDQCTYTDDDEIAHAECDAVDGAANVNTGRTEPPLCPDCWTKHAGECL